jgi:hypothetical protein
MFSHLAPAGPERAWVPIFCDFRHLKPPPTPGDAAPWATPDYDLDLSEGVFLTQLHTIA